MNLDWGTLSSVLQTLIMVIGAYYFYVHLISDISTKIAVLVSQREMEHQTNTQKFDDIEKKLDDRIARMITEMKLK